MAASEAQIGDPDPDDRGTVEASLFEGMFERAFQPAGDFAAQLQAAGYDPKRFQAKYPIGVWRDCLEIARHQVFPALPIADGYRALGLRFIQGFFETLIGKFVSVGLPLMGVDGLIKRSPKLWKAGRKGIVITPVHEGERRWRVTFEDKHALPDFIAGLVYGAIARLKVEPLIQVENSNGERFDLLVTW